jgi:hypothetical protein
MSETKIGTMVVRDVSYDVRVNGLGTFLADLDGQTVDADTYDGPCLP